MSYVLNSYLLKKTDRQTLQK